MNKAIFLDRDGVINVERGKYTFKPEDFTIEAGVKEALEILKKNGYVTVVITNQAGIAKGIYTKEDVEACHAKMHKELPGLIDDVFYAPHYPPISESLGRKPDSLLFERALALYNVDPQQSWMVGDNDRDLVPARKLGMHTVGIGAVERFHSADACVSSLLEAVTSIILK
ncbi:MULTISPECIES: HAD-IIIA family hydrolase [unclassified Imperialibacter]|uniref:D-glycero-alpha-D-manno-heptose-1,7-bisphosphate 7-phosphatase n=1 Tax=unclassified Imperialibacter TaxID=2629706 RepID=UPI00125526C4|nr:MULTISPECIES: HAD-IIIA family hydrolase [unclassified Imperialibacter]CAD5284820.1 D,D-heptose 1,7-bisphosphate phosphatase [Imperialibacter sp. 89]CAD5285531.1 D,D-heptose 1,7-bisphosphate phosphatase [Imperialibacter sp. 75]VVT27991.1 D,D-heptose 1,7-bisphosphate phosphatase [Imperialibacter sp. EC-SDR9]